MKRILLAAAALMMAPLANAGEIHILFSDELNEKIAEEYGERERERLVEDLTDDLTREFGGMLDQVGDVNVTIEDARPNRPTFAQMTRRSLAFESISIGGAHLVGQVFSENGDLLASSDYDYYTRSIEDARGATTWTDTRRAFDRFARRLASHTEDTLENPLNAPALSAGG